MQQVHENYSREETVTHGSDRSFGLVMGGAFALLALLNWWHDGRIWPWMVGLAAFFWVFALARPSVLNPLNKAWFKIGLLLHHIVNPIIMALLFYGSILPTGLARQILGKDSMRLKRQPHLQSYWITRQPPGPPPDTMKNQF